MTSSDQSTLILDQIREASLPQQASLDLMAIHGQGLERLASGTTKRLLVSDLCEFIDDLLGSWNSIILGDFSNGYDAVSKDACVKESTVRLQQAVLALPDLEVVYPVGNLSVESSVWQEACPERTVRYFSCFPVTPSVQLILTSNQSNRLEPSMETLVRLVARIATFIVDHEATSTQTLAVQTQRSPATSTDLAIATADLSNEMAFMLDSKGVILEVNTAAQRLLKQSAADLKGLAVTQLGAGSDSIRALKLLTATHSADRTHLALKLPERGFNVWVEARTHSLPSTNSDAQTVLFCHDISDEKTLQAKAEHAEEQLKAAAQSKSLILFSVDRRGVIASAQGGLLAQTNMEPSNLRGRSVWGFCQDESLRRKLWKQLRRNGQASGLIDTEIGHLEITLTSTPGPNGKPQSVHGIGVQIPAPVAPPPVAPPPISRPAPAIPDLCPTWLAALQVSKDAVVITDAEGRIRFMNSGAEQLFLCRMVQAEGQPFHQVGSFSEFDPVNAFINEDQKHQAIHQMRMKRHDGTVIEINLAGAAIRPQEGIAQGVILCCRQEIEEPRANPESALATSDSMIEQHQRLEQENFRALSLFAGGIAHDLNNILTSLVGNVSLANMLVTEVPEASERLIEAERACFRAKDLSHQLLTFAKGSTPVKKITRIEDLIKQCSENYLRGSKSVPRIINKPGLWSANIDEGQISQVLENLILNADHSMPHGGMVTISTENVHHVPGPENSALPLEEGIYVKVSVLDEGPGIPEDQLEYVFRPYHAANKSGRGLGLATTFTILKNHQGHVVATSKCGHGTEFSFYLPATGKTQQPVDEPAPLQPGETVSGLEQGRILIIDDEKSILDLATTTLKLMGCDVVACPSSSEGVERFIRANQEGRPFDLVIMDLTIPDDLGGNEAMQQILSISPKARVVASSGYSEGSVMARYREYGFQAALSKPYNISDLQRIVSNMLVS